MIDQHPDDLVVQRAMRLPPSEANETRELATASWREDQHMADSYDRYESDGNGGGFMMGLLTGTVLGAGLGMLLAPKAGAELRGAIGEQARNWTNTASEQYRTAREQAGTWAERGRDMVSQARDAVNRGVEEARGYSGGATGSTYGSGTGSGYGGSGSTGSTGGSSYGGSNTGSDFNRG
jgi:gas vesicle protein